LTGALSLFACLLLLWHPVESVVSVTLMLIAFFIAEGVFQMATAFGYASEQRKRSRKTRYREMSGRSGPFGLEAESAEERPHGFQSSTLGSSQGYDS
jgi:Short repeat of unknown function (DUF308)